MKKETIWKITSLIFLVLAVAFMLGWIAGIKLTEQCINITEDVIDYYEDQKTIQRENPSELINDLLGEIWSLESNVTYWKNKYEKAKRDSRRPPEKPQIVIVEVEPEIMLGDGNGDGLITQTDFGMFEGCFGAEISEFPGCKFADMDQDGYVGGDDLNKMLILIQE